MWDEDHVHAHAVLFLPQRQTITPDTVHTAWSQALNSTSTLLAARQTEIEPPREGVEAVLGYHTKAEQTMKLLTHPETGKFDPSFFSVYSEQTAGKHLHRLARFFDLS
jgi:hypothetical protein